VRYRDNERGELPFGRPGRTRGRTAAERVAAARPRPILGGIAPMRVHLEIHGGRDSTSSMMRARRVMHEIKEGGARAQLIEVALDGSLLVVDLDAALLEKLAEMPFVRRVITLS